MKTKLSTKVISLVLSVLMVVTAAPIASYATIDLSGSDQAVAAVKTQMTAFETALQTDGAMWTNVSPAYTLYVQCQKALDSYEYGSNTSALGTLASQLQTAIANMGTYDPTPDITSKIPTFANSTEANMSEYVGPGQPINNVLRTGQATNITSATNADVYTELYYYNGTVLLYDGSTRAALPIFFKTKATAKKSRYLYSVYPTADTAVNANSTGDLDYNVLQFTDYWCGGTQGDDQTVNVDWNWNWWSQWNGSAYHRPSYNYNTGNNYASKNTAAHRTQQLTYKTNWIGSFQYGYERTGSNALAVVAAPADYGAEYSPNWYVSTGDSANSDAVILSGSSATIKVINYKTLADAIAQYGAQMKSTPVSNFKEGGLATYIAAMDAATSYDVTANFANNADGYSTTVSEMRTLVTNMRTAANDASNHYDSTSYANLRTAVTTAIVNQGELGNTGYTTESWNKFNTAYQAVKNIFNALPNGSYSYTESNNDMDGMTYATALVTYYNALQTNVQYQDTSALMAALAVFDGLDPQYFTSSTYNSVQSQLDAIKVDVWGSLANYGVTTAGPVESAEAAALIAGYTADVPDIMRALRISPDAIAHGNGFAMSLNSAVAWQVSNVADNGMPKYSNYASFTTAQQNLAEYANVMARTPFTDFDTQYAEYVAQVGTVQTAYDALRYTFFGIDDGAIANQGELTTMTDMSHTHGRYTLTQTVSYTSSATLVKMTHNAVTADFGKFNIKNNCYNDGDALKDNNGIDSISINASYGTTNEINSATATSTPNAVDNAQQNYPGLLSSSSGNGDFSVHNFGISETSGIRNSFFARTPEDVYIYDAVSPEFDVVFGTTNGAKTSPVVGTAIIQDGQEKHDAFIVYSADFAVDLPSSTAVSGGNFTSSTGPKSYDLSYMGTHYGSFYSWNSQPSLAYAGYGCVQSSDTFNITIHVIDASNLVDLYTYISNWLAQTDANGYTNAQKYDGVTGSNGINQRLTEASDELDITHLTTNAIQTRLNNRYTNLLNAWNAKSLKTFDVGFTYNTDATHTTTETVTVNYGETLSQYATAVNAIIGRAQASTYDSGNYTYTFAGWQDEASIDMNEHITFNDSHTAIYTGSLNRANFTAHDTAKGALINKLEDYKYSVDQLTAVNNVIAADTYFNYTTEQKNATYADAQSAIDAQTTALTNAANALTPVDYAAETADIAAYVEQLAAYDTDMYSKTFTYTQNVTVDGTSYVALIYGTDAALQSYISSVLGSVKTYNVYLNNTAVMENVSYGTGVRINGDGTAEVVSDITEKSEGANYAWYYCYSAPSTNNVKTASKYYSTAPSYSFYVHGDTYVESIAKDGDANNFPVTFVADINGAKTKVFAVAYADANTGEITDMPSIPNYAGYAYSGEYTEKGGELIEEEGTYYASQPMTVVYHYEIDAAHEQDNSYEIVVWFLDGNELIPLNDVDTYVDIFGEISDDLAAVLKFDFTYNEKVKFLNTEFAEMIGPELLGEDVYAYALVDDIDAYAEGEGYTLTPLAFGGEYTFYAYDNLNIIPMTEDDYFEYFGNAGAMTLNVRDTVAPVYNAQGNVEKFTLVASFAAPEGVTATEYGYLFTSNTSTTGSDLTLDKVGKNGVARMKATTLTCGDQFVVNINNPSRAVSFNYVAYLTYTDGTGSHTIYSPVQTGNNDF